MRQTNSRAWINEGLRIVAANLDGRLLGVVVSLSISLWFINEALHATSGAGEWLKIPLVFALVLTTLAFNTVVVRLVLECINEQPTPVGEAEILPSDGSSNLEGGMCRGPVHWCSSRIHRTGIRTYKKEGRRAQEEYARERVKNSRKHKSNTCGNSPAA